MKKLILASILLTLKTTSFALTFGSLFLQGSIGQKISLAITPAAASSENINKDVSISYRGVAAESMVQGALR